VKAKNGGKKGKTPRRARHAIQMAARFSNQGWGRKGGDHQGRGSSKGKPTVHGGRRRGELTGAGGDGRDKGT